MMPPFIALDSVPAILPLMFSSSAANAAIRLSTKLSSSAQSLPHGIASAAPTQGVVHTEYLPHAPCYSREAMIRERRAAARSAQTTGPHQQITASFRIAATLLKCYFIHSGRRKIGCYYCKTAVFLLITRASLDIGRSTLTSARFDVDLDMELNKENPKPPFEALVASMQCCIMPSHGVSSPLTEMFTPASAKESCQSL